MSGKRITAGQVSAAQSELECIHDLAAEAPGGKHACYRFHAVSASRHIATLASTSTPLPAWIVGNWSYFKSIGWIPLHVAKPAAVSA